MIPPGLMVLARGHFHCSTCTAAVPVSTPGGMTYIHGMNMNDSNVPDSRQESGAGQTEVSPIALSAKLNRRGNNYTAAGKYPEAIKAFSEALAFPGPKGTILYNRAEAYRLAGDYEAAEADIATAIAEDGETADNLFALGLLAYERDEWDKAETYYKEALGKESGRPDVWNNLGVVDFRRGRYSSARDYFLKAVELDPVFEEAWFNLADCYDELGMHGERRDALKKLHEIGARAEDSGEEDDDVHSSRNPEHSGSPRGKKSR